MSHDKIKAAARSRLAATGEPYTAARRQVINEHVADRLTSAVSAEDIRAAAEVHRELGPDYSDAVVASFIDKVDSAVAARVEARLADRTRPKPRGPARLRERRLAQRVARDVLAASVGAAVAVGAIGLHEVTSPHAQPSASRPAKGPCASRVRTSGPCVVHAPTSEVRTFVITTTSDGQIKAVARHSASVHR